MARFALWEITEKEGVRSESEGEEKKESKCTEYDDGDVDGAQDPELICFFEEAGFALSAKGQGEE